MFSIAYCKVKAVKTEYDDLTMSLSGQILSSLNADFDGDVLNIISVKSNEFKSKFKRIFDPRRSMFVDRNTGYFNSDAGLLKDQAIGLSQFCIC